MHDIPFENLVSYAAGEMSESQAKAFAAQLACSPQLARDVEIVRSAIATMRADDTAIPPVELIERAAALLRGTEAPAHHDHPPRLDEPTPHVVSGLLDRAGCTIAALLFDSTARHALPGFRSGSAVTEGERHLMYGSPLGEVDLHVTSRSSHAASARVKGQIDCDGKIAAHITVIDRAGERIVIQCDADDRGCFTFHATPGEYDVRIDVQINHDDRKSVLLQDVQL